jgi:hypothetical protein
VERVDSVTSENAERITTVFCASALGQIIPKMMLVGDKRLKPALGDNVSSETIVAMIAKAK